MTSLFIVLLILTLLVGLTLTVIGLPGNWLMVFGVVVFTAVAPESPYSLSWWTAGLIAAMALVGEILELFAGLLGVNRVGGSRRAALMALVGSLVGAILGLFIGIPIPIPVVGSLIGLLLMAGLGAFIGAVVGEYWKSRAARKSIKVGFGAFIGRILGTAGKVFAGAIIACTVLVIWLGAAIGIFD